MLFVICLFYLIWVQTVYKGYQQAALVYKECGQAPWAVQNHIHGFDQFAPVRHGVTSQELFKTVGILSSKRNKT